MLAEESYWTRKPISRRGTVRGAVTIGGGLAALSLIGCGDGKPSTGAATSSPSGAPEPSVLDPTKGKPGGVFRPEGGVSKQP